MAVGCEARGRDRGREVPWAVAVALCVLAALGADKPARLAYPVAVASDADGTFYVADLHLPGVLRRDPRGGVDVFYRGSSRNRSPLLGVRALAAGKEGALFAADSATGDVFRLRTGRPPEALTGGAFEVPTGLAVAPGGDIFVTDLRLGTLSRIPATGGSPVTVAKVRSPRGVVVTPAGDLIVLSMGPDQLLRVTAGGRVTEVVIGRPFRFPHAVALDRDGTGYLVCDGYAATVWAVSPDGKIRPRVRGAPLVRPEGLAHDTSDGLLVADPGARQVFRVNATGEIKPLFPTQ